MNKKLLLLLPLLFSNGLSQAGWQDMLQKGMGELNKSGGNSLSGSAVSALSQTEMVDGLKEALAKGVKSAINNLGKKDGFLANDLVKIPVPSSVSSITKMVKSFGGAKYVDDFEKTMNRAAEGAVPKAADIFADSIRDMSIEDAQKLLNGGDNSATEFFRAKASEKLTASFKPMVKKATDAAGVTSAYKRMVGKAGPALSLMGGGNNALSDIDGYVTDKAIDGLFTMIAAEEKRIRDNPLGSGSDLLGKVFGSLK